MTSESLRRVLIAGSAIAALSTSGCASVAQLGANIAQSVSSSTPSQVTTLAEAEQAATLVTNATDLYVNTAHPSSGVLMEIKSLSDGLHAALVTLEQANAAGKSLTFSSFNAALQAFNAYTTSQGIPH